MLLTLSKIINIIYTLTGFESIFTNTENYYIFEHYQSLTLILEKVRYIRLWPFEVLMSNS